MQYRIKQLRVKNFKCFDDSHFFEFAIDESKNPIILSGPNGFGKTTFFDAVELIFSKKITRLDTSIEKKSTNLLKNILLNEAEKDGFLALTLSDRNGKVLTILVRIDHTVHKLFVEDSIQYGVVEETIETERLEEIFSGYSEWKTNLHEFEHLSYTDKDFDVYYYVSQAESVHFLKQSIAERKDSLNKMLNTDNVLKHISCIEELIGKQANTSGVIINDEIKMVENRIKNNIEVFTNMQKQETAAEKVGYQRLLKYPDNMECLIWDNEDISNLQVEELEEGIREIESLVAFVKNCDDYGAWRFNNKITLVLQRKGIEDFVAYQQFLEDGKISTEQIRLCIEENEKKIEIYNHSAFLRNDLKDTTKYKREDIEFVHKIMGISTVVDLERADLLVNEINELRGTLSRKQDVLRELLDAREGLHRLRAEYGGDNVTCPYCNHTYPDIETLEKAYALATKTFDSDRDNSLNKIDLLENSLKELFVPILNSVKEYISQNDDNKVNQKITQNGRLKDFIANEKRIADVEFINSLLYKEHTWKDMQVEEMKIEICRIIMNAKKKYLNNEFEEMNEKYDFESLHFKYGPILALEQSSLLKEEIINEKKTYIRNEVNKRNKLKEMKLKETLRDDILRLEKLRNVREKLNKLKKVYEKSIEEYKNMILEKLRVPLLIYTGKILQEYQNGLGVFISKDEMRFVATGDAKLDILNTFSSGQLSGFVLAFLFSMNKQYIQEADDDIGFILIDDPVQTMDDINISSLIEVMRTDFADKQIIMSTHETEKENYILYKFFKYNLTGQSFNVKEKLYGI